MSILKIKNSDGTLTTVDLYNNLIGKKVNIKCSNKPSYLEHVGKVGTVTRVHGSAIGVLLDNTLNKDSTYGVFWFSEDELKIIDNEEVNKEAIKFKYVAKVKLLNSCTGEYSFALYDEEYELLKSLKDGYKDALVVVNPRSKHIKELGIIVDIYTTEEFFGKTNITITAEVVGVVNQEGYKAREAEKVRQQELAKKKADIEKELEAEINKRKSIEYYEAMAKEYSDNPRLAELVAELKNLN